MGSCASPGRVAEWQQLVRRLKPTAVVAKDGSGDYRTVQARASAPFVVALSPSSCLTPSIPLPQLSRATPVACTSPLCYFVPLFSFRLYAPRGDPLLHSPSSLHHNSLSHPIFLTQTLPTLTLPSRSPREQAAVTAAREGAVIYIKAGRYEEQVRVGVRRLTLLGDGPSRTILSFNRSQAGHGASLTDSAVLGVQMSGFVAMGIAVENTAGVAGMQAVALLVNADRSAFYQCRFSGYQDTVFAWGKRQYYHNCTIEGSVDFIFGYASAVFDRCRLRVRKGRNQSYIAASGRALANDTGGFVFIDSRVETAGATRIALARPWGMCARTIYIRTYLDSNIMNEGWEAWHNRINSRTPYFAEFQSYGPGARPKLRPSWVQPGQISPVVASSICSRNFPPPYALRIATMATVDAELFQQKDKNPLVLLGAFTTAAVLVAGLASFKQGNDRRSQMLMRARVVAQGGTVALMLGTIGVDGFQERMHNFSQKFLSPPSKGNPSSQP
ncbi:unnamed protein product [Closterium sp. Naga37s-1]|nr:unnamed protein product [Closterium sp. Naga37s-1]